MCIRQDFNSLTEAQEQRDTAFIWETRDLYVVPLVAELEKAIPDYSSMREYERFAALMRLNEEHAPHGISLTLDFAVVASYVDEKGRHVANSRMRSRGLVFSGRNDTYEVEERNGLKIYTSPAERWSPLGTLGMHGSGTRPMLDDTTLPLPFRVALLALYVRENVFCTFADSCRFAAGITRDVKHARMFFNDVRNEKGQLFGWNVLIRDTMPTNELALYVAKNLRGYAESKARSRRGIEGTLPVAEYDPNAKQRRARHQSTELLLGYVDVYLPAHNKHVGRSGVGEHISWEKAWEEFEESYPNLYKDKTSFMNAYYNAKKARKQAAEDGKER